MWWWWLLVTRHIGLIPFAFIQFVFFFCCRLESQPVHSYVYFILVLELSAWMWRRLSALTQSALNPLDFYFFLVKCCVHSTLSIVATDVKFVWVWYAILKGVCAGAEWVLKQIVQSNELKVLQIPKSDKISATCECHIVNRCGILCFSFLFSNFVFSPINLSTAAS